MFIFFTYSDLWLYIFAIFVMVIFLLFYFNIIKNLSIEPTIVYKNGIIPQRSKIKFRKNITRKFIHFNKIENLDISDDMHYDWKWVKITTINKDFFNFPVEDKYDLELIVNNYNDFKNKSDTENIKRFGYLKNEI